MQLIQEVLHDEMRPLCSSGAGDGDWRAEVYILSAQGNDSLAGGEQLVLVAASDSGVKRFGFYLEI